MTKGVGNSLVAVEAGGGVGADASAGARDAAETGVASGNAGTGSDTEDAHAAVVIAKKKRTRRFLVLKRWTLQMF